MRSAKWDVGSVKLGQFLRSLALKSHLTHLTSKLQFIKERNKMKVSDFNYDLPEELIAQTPIAKRDESRLMVLDRKNKIIDHKIFKDIIDYLKPGDVLVRNNTKVIPARIYGKKETGANVEFLLLNNIEGDIWESIVRPGNKLHVGTKVIFGDGILGGNRFGVQDAFVGDDV